MSLTPEEHLWLETIYNKQYTIEETLNTVNYYAYWNYYLNTQKINIEFNIENLNIT